MKKFISIIIASQLAAVTAAYADSQVVVICNPSVSNVTKDQIADVFLGKSNALKPFDQPNTAPVGSPRIQSFRNSNRT